MKIKNFSEINKNFESINEAKGTTPKAFVKEINILMIKAENQMDDFVETLDEISRKANSGVWYFSGQMMNNYRIDKNEKVKELFQDFKSDIKDNTKFAMRDIRKLFNGSKNRFNKIKSINLKPAKK